MGTANPDMNLTVDVKGLFENAMQNNGLNKQAAEAYKYCQTMCQGGPQGEAATKRDLNDVKAAAKIKAGRGSVIFSGTLAQLSLADMGVPAGLDMGHAAPTVSKLHTVSDVLSSIGTVIVNMDMCSISEGALVEGLRRANKDAEVLVACLVCWWHRSAESCVQEALNKAMSDLNFDGRCLGTGAEFLVEVVKLIDEEDRSRQLIGASAFRKCKMLFLTSANTVDVEESAKIFKARGADPSWNIETIRRYSTIGRRCAVPQIESLVAQWEYHEGRNALIDGISVLRAATGAATTEEDRYYLLFTLFMEQRCKLRTSFKGERDLLWLFHGILIRRTLLGHVSALCPNFADQLQALHGPAFYLNTYGFNELGKKVKDPEDPMEHEEHNSDEEISNGKAATATTESSGCATSYTSLPLVRNLVINVGKIKWDKTLAKLAKQSGPPHHLDLTSSDAALLRNTCMQISQAYAVDVPPETPTKGNTVLVNVYPVVGQSPVTTAQVVVEMDHEGYKAALAMHVMEVKDHEEKVRYFS